MQREDFQKLCPRRDLTYRFDNPYFKGDLQVYKGFGQANVMRVIHDWFPEGSVVQLEGSTYLSRGPVKAHDGFGMRRPELHMINTKTMKTFTFSVRETLGLAEAWIKEQTK